MKEKIISERSVPAIEPVNPSHLQRMASDPSVSSWVGASAGSGKTKVLTDRLLRLLLPREDGLPGTAPSKILALTFTKAGANEMAMRLTDRLSEWATIPLHALEKDLEEKLLGRTPTKGECEAARKLFAEVIDTPGGLNIMTIHSFCQSILGRFPIEAGLSPHFKTLEDDAGEYLEQSFHDILLHAQESRTSPLYFAVKNLAALLPEESMMSLIKSFARERNQAKKFLQKSFGTEGIYNQLCSVLGVPADLSSTVLIHDFCTHGDESALRGSCAVLALGKARDQEKSEIVQAYWNTAPTMRPSKLDKYMGVFVAENGNTKLPNKDSLKNDPTIEGTYNIEAERIRSFQKTYRGLACAEATRDLFIVGDAVLSAYERRKHGAGALDFDDMILTTLSLLKGEIKNTEGLKVTPWVLYKLDGGLDHILVDEAQDTNPEQWEIIQLLSEEFFSGMGAQDANRTIFVVGDEKQSIFGFQRAAPEKLQEMQVWFEDKIRDAGQFFKPVDINISFRSVQTILSAVDSLFDGSGPVQGMGDHYLSHIAHRTGQAGLVELWPIFRTMTEEEDEASWYIPDTISESPSGSIRMAAKIADTIRGWLDSGERLPSYDRPIEAGDILILIRARNAFVGQLVRALKKKAIPVSGVDRMVLHEQLAVQDMTAAASFALLPDDDLTLGCLLKSPFVGMDEEELYRLSYVRKASLWDSIKKNGEADIVAWLEALIEKAGRTGPYNFMAGLVQESCPANAQSGLQAIYGRLGEDALDPVDEFLNAALMYERMHTPGLQGFLHAHMNGHNEIKRELDKAGSAVRIMTVHGSKGLQAPIVFLPDTVRSKKNTQDDKLLWPEKSGLNAPLFVPSRSDMPDYAQDGYDALDHLADEEYRRLLYVAMTRAEERLYIGGYAGKKGASENSRISYWYNDIRSALDARPDIIRSPSGEPDKEGNDIPILTLSSQRTELADKAAGKVSDKTSQAVPVPAWVKEKRPEEPLPPRPLTPSRPSASEPSVSSPLSKSKENKFLRGTLTHKLLQTLPAMPPGTRQHGAKKFLSKDGFGLSPVLQDEILKEVMDALSNPDFADVFGAASLAEVPITGLLPDGRLISGQIDRLVVRDKEVLIVDYKTNRPSPKNARDIPEIYRQQMRAYAGALKLIYPDRKIRAALFWTDGGGLMAVDLELPMAE